MRDSSGIYTVLLAALLLASCTSPACARGRSLFQMHDVHEAEMFPLFGNARLTAEQVRGMAWHVHWRSRFRAPAAFQHAHLRGK